MATAFSYSTGILHFRYPIQKATANPVLAHFQKTTANPVLVHATIKLLKPLHITRIGVRALHNGCGSEIDFNGTEWECQIHRVGSYREKLTCEGKIRSFLNSNEDTNNLTTKHAEYLSDLLEHMGTHGEENGGLVTLYKEILKPAHISRMWEIAGYNSTNKAADMLPLEKHSPVKWGGMSGDITQGISGHKRKPGDKDSPKPLKEFPLKGKWEMELHWCGNGEEYTVDFKGEKKGQVFVKKNLSGIPDGVKPSDLAFVFGADRPWPSSNPFVIYMRAAGPNVLIGQAWTGGENSQRRWAEVVVVKKVATA